MARTSISITVDVDDTLNEFDIDQLWDAYLAKAGTSRMKDTIERLGGNSEVLNEIGAAECASHFGFMDPEE